MKLIDSWKCCGLYCFYFSRVCFYVNYIRQQRQLVRNSLLSFCMLFVCELSLVAPTSNYSLVGPT